MRVLLSIVLVVAMVAGMIWLPEGSQSKAADSTMSLTLSKGRYIGDNTDGSWFMSVSTDADLTNYSGKRYTTTILVDGKEQTVNWEVGWDPGWNKWRFYSKLNVGNYIALSSRSIIIPEGTTFNSTSDGVATFRTENDLALTYISGTWVEGFSEESFAMRYIEDSSNGDTYISLKTSSATSTLLSTYGSIKLLGTVLVNGEEKTVAWRIGETSDGQDFIYTRYDVDSSKYISTAATRVEIPKGTFFVSENATHIPVKVTSEVVLTELGTNSWVEGCIDLGLSYDVVYSGNNFWQVKFKFNGDLSKVTTTTAYVYLDTEIDGKMVEDVAWLINIQNGTIYPDGTSPTVPSTATSVKIYAGTYSGGYVGTTCKIPIRITNDVGTQFANNTWYDMNKVWTVGAAYSSVSNIGVNPQIQLTTDQKTPEGWSGWFNGIVYIDGTASKARFNFNASTQSLIIGQQMSAGDTSDTVMAALLARKTVKVMAQTVLTPVQGQPGPVVLNLSSDLVLKWNGSAYEEGAESYDISLSFEAVNTTAYASEGYLQVRFKYEGDLSGIPSNVVTAYLPTEIDGTVVENVRWQIDKTYKRLYTTTYVSQVPADATSVKIYADTYSSGYTYTSGYTGETHNIPIHITNDVGTQLVLGTWNDVDDVQEVNATYKTVANPATKPQIQLTADSTNVAGWTGWFNGTVYIGDAEEALNARFYFEPNTQTIYIGQNDSADNVMSAMLAHKKVKIKAQTELSTVQSQTGPVVLNLSEDLVLVYSTVDGNWYIKGQEPQIITTNLSYKNIITPDGKDAYQLNLVVDNYADLVEEYSLWSWFEGTIKVNGVDRVVAFQLGSDLFASIPSTQNLNAGLPLDTISFEIPEGTVFTDVDGSSANPLKVSNTLSYVQVDGNWYVKGQEPRDITTNVSYKNITIPEGKEAYQLNLAVDNYADLVEEYSLWSWFEGTIKVNGEDKVVAFQLGSDLFASIPSTQNANAGLPFDTTVIEIPVGTIFKDVDGSSTNNLVINNRLFYVKVGTAWTTYTKEYQYPNGNVLYYNIDNGSGYMLTSSNGAIKVEELPNLVAGDIISKVGTYNITRVENETLYKEQIVLYKHGDADENDAIDARDLVAMKWAKAGTSDKQNARQAGTYAADIDRSDDVDDIDLRAMRLALVSDDAANELKVSKGNSVLNGVMPIAGFSTPIDEAYITEDMYQLFADAGINSITYCGNTYDSSRTLAEKHLQLAEANNLKLYVTDDTITGMTEDNFASRVGLYSMYHSFAGLHIVDEPTSGVYVNSHGRPIADYTNAISLCNGAANVNGYVNLTPYYRDYTSTAGSATTSNYKEYLTNTFTNTGAEILSYDHYPIRVGEAGFWESLFGQGDQKVAKAADFYANLEMVRKQVEGTDKPFWAFAQAGAVSTKSGDLSSSILPTAAEQQWQINAALAMGAKGIQYWQLFQGTNYAGADGDYDRSGLIGANGQVNGTFYNAAKAQNAFIAVVDEVLMNATNEGVIVKDSTASSALSSDVKLSSYNEISSVTGSNAMAGCFDYYGKTALLVVNCNTSSTQDITLNFNKSCNAYITKMGDTEVNRTTATAVNTSTGATINVAAGQSALVIIE